MRELTPEQRLSKALKKCADYKVSSDTDLWPAIYNQLNANSKFEHFQQNLPALGETPKATKGRRHSSVLAVLTTLAGFAFILTLLAFFDNQNKSVQREVPSALDTAQITSPARPDTSVSFSIVIYGLRTYFPRVSNEIIRVNLINDGNSPIYTSQFCNTLLQRQSTSSTKDVWEDIAYGRPCPSNDSKMVQLLPQSALDISFEFAKTNPLPGKSWLVSGTYRLLFTYYVSCLNIDSKVSSCEGRYVAPSDLFKINVETMQPGKATRAS